MARASKKRPLTERERQERFVAMAREVEASEDPKDFDRAFQKIAMPPAKSKADNGG